MKSKNLLLLSFLSVFVTACSTPGDFCLSASPIPLEDPTAVYLVENDLDAARAIAGHNTVGEQECDWEIN